MHTQLHDEIFDQGNIYRKEAIQRVCDILSSKYDHIKIDGTKYIYYSNGISSGRITLDKLAKICITEHKDNNVHNTWIYGLNETLKKLL